MSEPLQETALGKYVLRGTLGRGGMGTVYDGWDPVIARRVAIKTVRLPDAQDEEAQSGLARFRREAQAAGRLLHPNIVGVFDYGETNDAAFIVMEFVDGQTLKQMLDSGENLPLAETVRVIQDILAGLAYSHERGVVHRDIKPANVMITRDNQAKIADFGIARIESSSMTQAGTVLGTPAYMSPEQFTGQTVDRRTDIYSAGVLLYELLTCERPFEGSLTAIMHKALNTKPLRPSQLSVTAPAVLDAVVGRAMARRPEDRYGSADDFAKAITRAMRPAQEPDATIIETPPPAPPQPVAAAPPRGRNTMAVSAAIIGLLAIGGGGTWFLYSGKPTKPVVASSVAPAAPAIVQDAKPPPNDIQPQPVLAPSPPPSPPPPPPPVRSASAIAASLAASLPAIGCTLTHAAVAPGAAVTVTGVSGGGSPDAALRRAVASAGPAATDWQVASFDGPYCSALDLLRPVAEAGSPLALAQADGRAALADNDVIAVGLTMPSFGGYLHVAYLQHDGTASPLVPGPGYPARAYAAGSKVEFGRPAAGFDGWRVGPPFGTDMIVAIASSAPLFTKALPDSQRSDAYLRDLQAAMDALRRRGGSLAANAMVLETRPGR